MNNNVTQCDDLSFSVYRIGETFKDKHFKLAVIVKREKAKFRGQFRVVISFSRSNYHFNSVCVCVVYQKLYYRMILEK